MLFDILPPLGLGEQLFTAGVLTIVVWYLFRGKLMVGAIIQTVGTVTTIIMGALAVIAVSVGLGWFDPRPGVVFEHVSVTFDAVKDFAAEAVMDWLSGMMP